MLVKAMPMILEDVPDAKLVLAGRVDMKEPIEVAKQLCLGSDQVKFLGETAHDDVVELMKISLVFAS